MPRRNTPSLDILETKAAHNQRVSFLGSCPILDEVRVRGSRGLRTRKRGWRVSSEEGRPECRGAKENFAWL